MTLRTLLIPTDGSEMAARAARRGFALATQLDADVHVLSVADSSLATGVGYSGDSPRMRRRLRERAAERADRAGQEASSRGLAVTTATREGIPAQEIVAYANEHDLDGIVIGTSGRGGVSRAVIGSVADKVIRTASTTVITLNRPTLDNDAASDTIESLCLPTDGSESAARAAKRGIELAERLDARVHVLSVVPSALAAEISSWAEEGGVTPSEIATDAVDAIAVTCQERGLDVVTAVRTGRAAEEIVDYVGENEIDGIVIGTQGHGGFERWLLGSVTDSVVRTAPVPVLTNRTTEVPPSE